jgi:hypothetical protein
MSINGEAPLGSIIAAIELHQIGVPHCTALPIAVVAQARNVMTYMDDSAGQFTRHGHTGPRSDTSKVQRSPNWEGYRTRAVSTEQSSNMERKSLI